MEKVSRSTSLNLALVLSRLTDLPLTGILTPSVWCNDHPWQIPERKTYDLGSRDQTAKIVRSPFTSRLAQLRITDSPLALRASKTALQLYVRTYKGPKPADQPLRLRQAKRLDSIIEPVLVPRVPTPPPLVDRYRPSLLTGGSLFDLSRLLPES